MLQVITLQREEIKLREAGENAWKSGKKVKYVLWLVIGQLVSN